MSRLLVQRNFRSMVGPGGKGKIDPVARAVEDDLFLEIGQPGFQAEYPRGADYFTNVEDSQTPKAFLPRTHPDAKDTKETVVVEDTSGLEGLEIPGILFRRGCPRGAVHPGSRRGDIPARILTRQPGICYFPHIRPDGEIGRHARFRV